VKKVLLYNGNNEERLRASPLLETFASRGIDVLIGSDEIDELAFATLGQYEGMSFKSVNHSDSDDDLGAAANHSAENDEIGAKAAEAAKRILGDKVKDVRLSKRLEKSPSCVVMDKDDPTLQYRELMKRISNVDMPEAAPILEINPGHVLVKKLAELEAKRVAAPEDAAAAQDAEDIANILLDQALSPRGTSSSSGRIHRAAQSSSGEINADTTSPLWYIKARRRATAAPLQARGIVAKFTL